MFLLYYFFLRENGLNAIIHFGVQILQRRISSNCIHCFLPSVGTHFYHKRAASSKKQSPALQRNWAKLEESVGERLSAASQGLHALPKKKTHPAPPRWSNCPEASVFSQVLISTGIRNSQPPTCGILKAQSCKALLMSSAAVSFSSRLGVGPTAVSFLFLTEGNILIQISHRSGVLVCFSRLPDDRSNC